MAWAALIASDDFLTTSTGTPGDKYSLATINSRISGQSPLDGVVGFGGAVSWTSGGSGTSFGTMEATGLTHPLMVNPPTGYDGDVYMARAFNTARLVHRSLDATASSAITAEETNGRDLWFGALLRVGEVLASSKIDRSLMGIGSNTTTAQTSGFAIGTDGDEIRLYYKNSSGSFVSSPASLTMQANTAYLLAVQVEFNAVGANERVTLKVYDSDDAYASPSATLTVTDAAIAAGDLVKFMLSTTGVGDYTSDTKTPRYDAMRLGTDLGDVMVVPEPASVAALALAGALALVRRRRR